MTSAVIEQIQLETLRLIAEQFADQQTIVTIQPFGNGNINDTFLVTLADGSGALTRLVLQRINTQVFHHPHLIMQNMRVLTQHVCDRLQREALERWASPLPHRRWEVPRVILTQAGHDYWRDSNGSVWRAISFIEGAESFDQMESVAQAGEVGYALGMFHNLISDLEPDRLADTLEGFHITPQYLRQYKNRLATASHKSPEIHYCQKFIDDRQDLAHVLERAKTQKKLPIRLMHGDPKVNNVMFDRHTEQAVSVVDLDTVKPGLVHYDIGDCLRSGCNPIGEETEQWESVAFEADLCQGLLQGYLSVARAFLTENDYLYLYDAIRLLAFELGLRFFTDHLAGNVYFKVKHPEHNLIRALVQFKLAESIEAQEKLIRALIRDLR